MCQTCHRTVHAHPVPARDTGWVVSQWVEVPGTVPVTTPWGDRTHHCDGKFTLAA